MTLLHVYKMLVLLCMSLSFLSSARRIYFPFLWKRSESISNFLSRSVVVIFQVTGESENNSLLSAPIVTWWQLLEKITSIPINPVKGIFFWSSMSFILLLEEPHHELHLSRGTSPMSEAQAGGWPNHCSSHGQTCHELNNDSCVLLPFCRPGLILN